MVAATTVTNARLELPNVLQRGGRGDDREHGHHRALQAAHHAAGARPPREDRERDARPPPGTGRCRRPGTARGSRRTSRAANEIARTTSTTPITTPAVIEASARWPRRSRTSALLSARGTLSGVRGSAPARPCQAGERWLPSRADASTEHPSVKRRLLSSLFAMSLIVATGCSITLGKPPEAGERRCRRSSQPRRPSSPDVSGFPGRIAVLDASGTLTVFEADGSHPTVIAGSDPDVTLVRQPTWSRDGTRIAWVGLDADGTSATVMTAAFDGTQTTDTAVAAAPFYLSWDPTSSRIVYLGGSATADIELGLVDVAASTTAPIDAGSPFYFSWAPKGNQLLVHVGTDRLDRLAIDGTFTLARGSPGTVQRAGLDRGRTHVVLRVGGGRPATAGRSRRRHRSARDPREVRRRDHVRRESRRRTRRVPGHPRRPGAGRAALRDRSSRPERPIAWRPDYSAAFFWSPDGTKLLSLGRRSDERLVLPVERVGGRERRSRPDGSFRASSSAATTSRSSSSTRRA